MHYSQQQQHDITQPQQQQQHHMDHQHDTFQLWNDETSSSPHFTFIRQSSQDTSTSTSSLPQPPLPPRVPSPHTLVRMLSHTATGQHRHSLSQVSLISPLIKVRHVDEQQMDTDEDKIEEKQSENEKLKEEEKPIQPVVEQIISPRTRRNPVIHKGRATGVHHSTAGLSRTSQHFTFTA